MRITAKADYAVRAALELAASHDGQPLKADELARRQGIPLNFLANILNELRRGGIVRSQRGAGGGYRLARPSMEITVADVLRAVEGPLAAVQGQRPETLLYDGAAKRLPDVWIALRANLRSVLEHVTLDEIAQGLLPATVAQHARGTDAWRAH